MLKAIKFFNVDQIAGASDEQIANIGMHGGMQPLALREKARQFLNVAKNATYAEAQSAELKKRDEEIAVLRAKDAERDQQVAAMQQQLAALAAQAKAKKGGRPRKESAEA